MLKVASYNMRKAIGTDRLRRPDRICDVLCEIGADIIALQEADRRFGERVAALPLDLLERCTPYRAVPLATRGGSIGWHGNAILVRNSIEVLTHAHVALPVLEPRGAVIVELRVHGAPIRVVGMHLDLSGLQRRKQARAVIAAVEARRPMATVLMGDLNEWTLRGGCLKDFGEHFRFAQTGPSFHSRRPVARLDRIMVNPALKVLSAGVHHSSKARRASDHLPIWARLSPA